MSGFLPQHSEILLYDNGADKQFVSVVFKDETFWLTQSGMAELFDCSADNISLHLKNIYADGELEQAATTEKFSVVRKEGSREVRRGIDHYNLDTIIAVGYRVNSKKATHFRQWATKTLKEYIQKGFVLNDELMKNGRPLAKITLMNCWSASGRSGPASAGLTRKLPMCLSSAATTMIKTARPRKRSTPSCRTSSTLLSPVRQRRN